MIITRQSRVPWSWVWLSQLPFAFWMFTTCLQNTAFTLSLKKFIDNPALLATTLSLANLPVLVIAPLVNYASDRVWTRFGRRKPFYVAANACGAVCMALMPLAPGYWALTGLLWAFQISNAFGKTFFPLSQEVIPVPQRGRGSAIHTVMFQVGILLYYSCMLGRFDDVYAHGPLAAFGPLDGEHFTYWLCALLMLLPLLIVAYGIKELPIPDAHGEEAAGGKKRRLGLFGFLRRFFSDVFDRQWAVLYLLLFGGALYGLGLGPLQALLYTEQWGYSLQDMGTNVALGTLIMMPLIAVCGWVADRFSKLTVYLWAIGAATVLNLAYFLFVMVFLPDRRPALWQILVFGELIAICGQVVTVVSWPLVFEYIPRRRMGTASAGMEMMHSLFGVVLPPLVGLFVAAHSALLLAPPGPRAELVLAAPATREELAALLAPAGLDQVHLEPLPAPGEARSAPALRWSVRADDGEGKALIERRKALENQISTAQLAASAERDPELEEARLRLNELETELAARADAFRVRLSEALGPRLAPSGAQVRAASWGEAPTWVIPATDRLSRRQVATLDRELRLAFPEVIQVEALALLPGAAPDAQGVRVVLSPRADTHAWWSAAAPRLVALPMEGERPDEHPGRWQGALAWLGFAGEPSPAELRAELAGALDIAAASPAPTRPALALTLALLTTPEPSQLAALEAALRRPGVRALRVEGDAAELRFVAAYWDEPEASSAPIPAAGTPVDAGAKSALVAASAAAGRAAAAQALYLDARLAVSAQGGVVPQPITRSDYAARRYDYFSAYLATITGGVLAIFITLYVVRCERRGLIRKLGVEEAEAEAAAATASRTG